MRKLYLIVSLLSLTIVGCGESNKVKSTKNLQEFHSHYTTIHIECYFFGKCAITDK